MPDNMTAAEMWHSLIWNAVTRHYYGLTTDAEFLMQMQEYAKGIPFHCRAGDKDYNTGIVYTHSNNYAH